MIDQNQLEATRLDQYRAWLEGERAAIAAKDQEIIRQSQSIAQERLRLSQDKCQEDARVQAAKTASDIEAQAQQDRAQIQKQRREEQDRAMADIRRRQETLDAAESALEERSQGYQARLEEVALVERRLEAENDRLQQKHLETNQRREQQTRTEQLQAEFERRQAELKQRRTELQRQQTQQQQQQQQEEEQQTRQQQHQPATAQTPAFEPFEPPRSEIPLPIPPRRPLSLLHPDQQHDKSLRGSIFQPGQPDPDGLEEARKRLEALLARLPPDDTGNEPQPVRSGGPGAALITKMAETPLFRPAPPSSSQNTFSAPDNLSVSDTESVRSVAVDPRCETPRPASASRFETPPLWPWQTSGHDLGPHGLDNGHTRPDVDDGNFDDTQVHHDNDEWETASSLGPSWSMMDALEKARQGKPEDETQVSSEPGQGQVDRHYGRLLLSSLRLGCSTNRQLRNAKNKDLHLGPSMTILEGQHEEKKHLQPPVLSFA